MPDSLPPGLAVAIVKHSIDSIISVASDGVITSWNPGAERMFGYRAEEAIGRPMAMLFPPELAAAEAARLAGIDDGSPVEPFETVRLRKDGARLNVSVALAPMLDCAGRVSGATSITRDITRRKRLEVRLRHYEAIVQSSTDSIVSKDLAGRIISWNAGAEVLFGYTAAEALGKELAMLIPAERPDEESLLIARLQNGLRIEHFETVRVRKDGSRVDISLSVSPLLDEHGRLCGACGIARDNTAHKRRTDKLLGWALEDPLTGLPNRRALVDRLAVALRKSDRSGHHAALLFIDLDDFKQVNDRSGHRIGDSLLGEVAARIKGVVREADTVARIGGDEFVVLPDVLDADRRAATLSAQVVARKLLQSLRRISIGGEQGPRCSASIGVTVFNGFDLSLEELLSRADRAMYDAKAAGKNRVRVLKDRPRLS